jgi:integrase
MARIRIDHVEFRGKKLDQPRFKPSPTLIRLGFKARPLRHPDGTWFTADQCRAFIETEIEPEIERRRAAREAGRRIRPLATRKLMTVGKICEAYADMKAADGAPAATVRDYRQKARALLSFDPEFYGTACAAVHQRHVFDLYERMRRARGLATAAGVVRTLSASISYGMLRGWVILPSNPCAKMRMKAPPPRVRAGTPAEMAALLAAADATGRPDIGVLIRLGLWTGQRQGDRLSLLEGQRSNSRIVFRQSKTGKIVSVPYSPELVAALDEARRLKSRHCGTVVPQHVAINIRTGQPFNEHTFRHEFAKVRAAAVAGIRDQSGGWTVRPCKSLSDFRDQDLRDTAVTWLVRAGSDHFEVASITGHELASVHTILKHYLADHPERADAAIAKMVTWFEQQTLEQTHG